MNAGAIALLLLSVILAASALTVSEQIYNEEDVELNERNLQTQSEDSAIPISNYPWDQGQNIENSHEAVQIPSESIESVKRTLRALEQRNIAALQGALKTKKSKPNCETYEVCDAYHIVKTTCNSWVLWACVSWNEEKECSRKRWVTTCPRDKSLKRSGEDESSVKSTENNSEQSGSKTSKTELVNEEELETVIAHLQSESLATFRDVYNKKVVKAEKYELPASTSAENVNSRKNKLDAVIVTLADERRFAIALGREVWNDQPSAILDAGYVTDDWQLVKSKDVQFSTIADYIKASDSSDSSEAAAEKMMELD